MWNKFQSKRFAASQRQAALRELPCKADRLLLYRRVERVVHERCDLQSKLLDPRTLGIKRFVADKAVPATKLGIRKRQLDYWKLQFLPTVSAALLLEIQDVLEDDDSEQQQDFSFLDDEKKTEEMSSLSAPVSASGEAAAACSASGSTNANTSSSTSMQQPVACMALLVSNMVLVSDGNYDARARSVLKQVCVGLFTEHSIPLASNPETDPHRALYFLTEQHVDDDTVDAAATEDETTLFEQTSQIPAMSKQRLATMQFEALERAVATDILKVMVERDAQSKAALADQNSPQAHKHRKSRIKDALVKGLQITTVGVVVGGLFAVTGGLAAPGLVAAITAFGVHGSLMFATLTTTTALASMFGVVGGGLGAYKMSKRVKGLSEWKIRQETAANAGSSRRNNSPSSSKTNSPNRKSRNSPSKATGAAAADTALDQVTLRGLHAHVCVSGWLADRSDFQVPFGVQANDPPLSRLPALQRFFTVHGPAKVKDAKALLKANKGEEDELWFELAGRYGRSPDHLLPFAGQQTSGGGSGDTNNSKAVLLPEHESEILGLLTQHVLSEESAEKMKEIWETSTMLVEMEAKNQEMMLSQQTSFPSNNSLGGSNHSSTTGYGSDTEGGDAEERMKEVDRFLEHQDDEEQMRRLKEEALLIEAACLQEKQNNNTSPAALKDNDEDEGVGRDETTNDRGTENNESLKVKESESSGESGDTNNGDVIKTASQSKNAVERVAGDGKVLGTSACCDDGHPNETDETLNEQTATKNKAPDVGVQNAATGDQSESSSVDSSKQVDADAGNDGAKDSETSNHEATEKQTNDGEKEDTSNNEHSSSSEADDMTDHLQIIWDWQATYQGEMYTVTWETDFLLKLCRVATVLFLELSDQVGKQLLTNALVGGAVMLPSALLTASGVIDDPYQIITLRAKKSGIELAHCLMTSEEHRPISLVGFSFGARVIFDCLLELAKHQKIWQERRDEERDGGLEDESSRRGRRRGKASSSRIEYIREPASIVEDVVLIGMPRTIDTEQWISCREIVGGRLVNCYNKKDWIVAYMIKVRCAGGIRKTTGTHPIENVEGVENYEVSDFASTHDRYRVAVPLILNKVGYSQPQPAAPPTGGPIES